MILVGSNRGAALMSATPPWTALRRSFDALHKQPLAASPLFRWTFQQRCLAGCLTYQLSSFQNSWTRNCGKYGCDLILFIRSQ